MTLTAHLYLVPSLRVHISAPPLPDMFSSCGALLSTEYFFMAWCLIKHRDYYTFLIIKGPENFTINTDISKTIICILHE